MTKNGLVSEGFSEILKILHFIGLYPSHKQSVLDKLWAYGLFIIFDVVLMILITVNLIYPKNSDITRRNFMLLFVSEGIFSAFKVLTFLIYGSKMKECILYFNQSRFMPTNAKERKILLSCSQLCQKLFQIFFVTIASTAILVSAPCVLSKTYTDLPLDLWLPYDPSLGKKIYFTSCFIVLVAISYNAMSFAAVDPVLSGLQYYAIGYLRILKYNLANLEEFANKQNNLEEYYTITYDSVNKILERCIILHNDILFFMNFYEDCFSWSLFSQLTGTMLCLCFCCITLSTLDVPVGSFEFSATAACTVITVSQIFFYCYFGTLVREESIGVLDAIYSGPWYKYDKKIRYILIIIMERSKRPITITAGRIINLSVETFVSTVKTSYSLIALMKTMV